MRGKGGGRFFLRGRVYWIAYSLHGTEYRESAKTGDAKKAETFLKHRMKEVGADQIGAQPFLTPQSSRLTVKDLIDALRRNFELVGKLSAQTASHLRRVEADLGERRAINLTAEKIDKYIQERLAEKRGPDGQSVPGDRPATINRSTQLLGQAFRLAVKNKHLHNVPSITRLSEKGNERQGFLTPAEFAKVLAALPGDLKDFCEWGYATGMRKGETSSLTWSMIEGDELRIPGNITKNRKGRILPLSTELAEIIERRRSARMMSENGTARMVEFIFHRNGVPIREFRKSWTTACRKAGVTGTRYHDLRRSAARNLTQAGVPREIAKKVTGHVSDSMWERYNIVITDDVRAALEKTEKYRTTAQQKVVSIG